MKLSDLLLDMPYTSVKGNTSGEVTGLTKDSRAVEKGFMFFVTGKSSAYLDEAIRRGAAVFVAETPLSGSFPCTVVTPDVTAFVGKVASRFYGFPSRRLHVAGITGTNGKTTITYLIESMVHRMSRKAGVIGTISYRYDGRVLKAPNTTPGAVETHSLLKDMVDKGVEYVAMEVSSHALDQKRVEGVEFDVAVLTNLTHDHLDYHGDFRHYREAKQRLFHHYLKESAKEVKYAIINRDDPAFAGFIVPGPVKTVFYSLKEKTDASVLEFHEDVNGIRLRVSVLGEAMSLASPLVGSFNASNILAAVLYGAVAGLPFEKIAQGIEALEGVPGRLERVRNDKGLSIFVDYAHTPDALEKVLVMLNRLKQGRLIVIFGCGGDRDPAKRPIMGEIASRLADFSIITSDNPRSEDPGKIIGQIRGGFLGNSFKMVENRRDAINEGLIMAGAKDIILVAGKGHEDYQIVGDKVLHFSDRETVEESLNVARG
jgi:UDP-N-acetylmuramoyl-L-alanyl-D-glutamate--2,6-diaminopimelate ligase